MLRQKANLQIKLSLVADVSHSDEVLAAVQQLVDREGGLDIVVANAGINGVWAPIDEITPDESGTTIAVNLRGTYPRFIIPCRI